MTSLNDKYDIHNRQRAIKEFDNGLLVAIAGPGTGKTYGLLLRADRLAEEGISADKIQYITFIREITSKFKEDLHSYFNGKSQIPPNIQINTLHSFAWSILRNLGHHINLPKHIEIINLDWNDDLAKIILNDIQSILKLKSKKKLTCMLKSYLDFRRKEKDLTLEAKLFLPHIKDISRELRILDWDTIIPLAKIVVRKEGSFPAWVRSIEHFMADEYQDFNPSEHSFFLGISSHASSVVIAGDPHQSIYSGRGASPKELNDLASEGKNYSLNLVECRKRPPRKIIQAANNLLRQMAGNEYENVKLVPGKDEEGNIRILSLRSAKVEIERIVEQINVWTSTTDKEYKNIIGLFPSWDIARVYEKLLSDNGIPVTTKSAENKTIENAKLVLKLMFLKSQPFIERVILSSFQKINKEYVRSIRNYLNNTNGSVVKALECAMLQKKWDGDKKKESGEYIKLIKELTSDNIDEAINAMSIYIGRDMKIHKNIIVEFLSGDRNKLLEKLCNDCLSQIFKGDEDAESNKKIKLLSMHSAKGLSRKYVFIPACEQAFMPGSIGNTDKMERLRLFYIAITRAESELLITYPRSRDPKRKIKGPLLGRCNLSEFAKMTKVEVETL